MFFEQEFRRIAVSLIGQIKCLNANLTKILIFSDIAKEILHPRPDLVFGLPRDKTGDAIIDAAISGAQDQAECLLSFN